MNLNQFTLKIGESEFLIDSNMVIWIDSAFFVKYLKKIF